MSNVIFIASMYEWIVTLFYGTLAINCNTVFKLYCSKLQNLLAENTACFFFFWSFWYLMFLNMSMINLELMNVSVCNLLLRFFGFPQTLTLAWKACKANCVTSLSSSSLKVLLTAVGSSVNKLRQALITLAIRVVLFPKISQIGLQSFLVIPMGTLSYHLENERARSHAQLPKRVRSFTTIAIERIRCGLDFSRI